MGGAGIRRCLSCLSGARARARKGKRKAKRGTINVLYSRYRYRDRTSSPGPPGEGEGEGGGDEFRIWDEVSRAGQGIETIEIRTWEWNNHHHPRPPRDETCPNSNLPSKRRLFWAVLSPAGGTRTDETGAAAAAGPSPLLRKRAGNPPTMSERAHSKGLRCHRTRRRVCLGLWNAFCLCVRGGREKRRGGEGGGPAGRI